MHGVSRTKRKVATHCDGYMGSMVAVGSVNIVVHVHTTILRRLVGLSVHCTGSVMAAFGKGVQRWRLCKINYKL